MNSNDPAQANDPPSLDPAGTTTPQVTDSPPDIMRLAYAILWVGGVLIAGSVVASFAVLNFGEIGLIVMWPIGWAGGAAAAKILGARSKLVGVLMIGSCLAMAVIAEVSWIQANIRDAEDSWLKAFTLLPAFARQYRMSAILAVCFAVMASISAWQQTAVRYMRVRVAD